jgi:uncharacterized protein (UPF0210 family)
MICPNPDSTKESVRQGTRTARSAELKSLRAIAFYHTIPNDPPGVRSRTILAKGVRLLKASYAGLPRDMELDSTRIVLPSLDRELATAATRSEAERIARDEFRLREEAASELNDRAASILGRSAPPTFAGGFSISAHGLPQHSIHGFLDALIAELGCSRWQFASIVLGDAVRGINECALKQTADTIARLGGAGTRFAPMFGFADHTPFFPCAQHRGTVEGVSIGMSDPAALRTAIHERATSQSMENTVRRAQRDMLRRAAAIGWRIAAALGVPFLGCDPSQAPKFSKVDPRTQSIGAVIEDFSGVPLGLPGTKDGFFRLMQALRHGGEESAVPLCGFRNGSFLPVSEDAVIAAAVGQGRLSYSGILSLSHVCAAGLDMAVLEPGTPGETIARVLRDVGVTHLIKGRPLAARLIVPEYGTPIDSDGYYVFGGLLGRAPVLPLGPESC